MLRHRFVFAMILCLMTISSKVAHAAIIGAGLSVANGISGNIVLGKNNLGKAALYNDVSHTTVVLNVPGNSHASGMSGDYIVGTFGDSHGNSIGFLYSISAGTYVALQDPLARISTGSGTSGTYGTVFNGIDGDNIVGDYYDATGKSHGLIYNITSQTFTTLDYFTADTELTGIDGNYILGSVSSKAVIYNGVNWTPVSVPGSLLTEGSGIFGTTIVGGFGGLSGGGGYVYDFQTGTFTYPVSLNDISGAITFVFIGISGEAILGRYTFQDVTFHNSTGYFVYTVPELTSISLSTISLIGLLVWRFKRGIPSAS